MTFFAVIWATAIFCSPYGPPGSWDYGQAYYNPYSQAIVLGWHECKILNDAPRSNYKWSRYDARTYDVTNTLFVLAHEEGHAHDPLIDNSLDNPYIGGCSKIGPCEAYADCFGLANVARLARVLGFSGYTSRLFQKLAYADRKTIGYAPIRATCGFRLDQR